MCVLRASTVLLRIHLVLACGGSAGGPYGTHAVVYVASVDARQSAGRALLHCLRGVTPGRPAGGSGRVGGVSGRAAKGVRAAM